MFDFLTGIYCFLLGWIITPETCENFSTNLSLHRRVDVQGYFGGKRKKTIKNRKHKNKTAKRN